MLQSVVKGEGAKVWQGFARWGQPPSGTPWGLDRLGQNVEARCQQGSSLEELPRNHELRSRRSGNAGSNHSGRRDIALKPLLPVQEARSRQ